jgi:succinate dehydrogenase/fumarate reductase-like Fe-S protein
MSGTTTTLAITRAVPGGEPRVEEHVVPYEDGLTLLDAIIWIGRHRRQARLFVRSARSARCDDTNRTAAQTALDPRSRDRALLMEIE